MSVTRYLTRHPHTGDEITVSNREWRCLKVFLPIDSSLWTLLSTEKEYATLLIAVTERDFDPLTLKWLVEMIELWPADVTISPQVLLEWYVHIATFHNIDDYAADLLHAQELKAQLEKIKAKRAKEVGRLARSIQREIKQLQKLQAAKARNKRKLKKRRGR